MKRLIFILAILSTVAQAQIGRHPFYVTGSVATGGGAFSASDDFTGTGALAADWTAVNGTLTREADSVVTSTTDADAIAKWVTGSPNANQWASVVFKQGGTGANWANPEVLVRVTGTSLANLSCYMFYSNGESGSSATTLYKYTNGVTGELASYTATFTRNDTMKISASGIGATVTLKVYKNGTQLGTDYSDSTSPLTSGVPGIGLYKQGSGKSSIDTFRAGDL